MATKVKLRHKPISGNRQSLYLDFYPAIPHPETGEPTRREFLGLYLFGKAKNPIDKQHNKETLQLAEQIRQKRYKQLNGNEALTDLEKRLLEKDKKEKEQGERSFLEYFKRRAYQYKGSELNSWLTCYKYLENFTKGNLKFIDLTEKFCNEFKRHLQNTKSIRSKNINLSKNSAASYFNKFKAALKLAYKDGDLQIDLNSKVECIETDDVIKNTLTIEELNTIARTDYENELCKRVVLFSALTGMPFKEMDNLTWGQVETSKTFGIRIKMIRQKTGKAYSINISEQAYSLLGDPKEPAKKVFEGLNNKTRYSDFENLLAKAGIKKDMTFHDLRHTYGTLQIDMDTDIYTLQSNMGHSNVRQTMNYAKWSDRKKREAADKIKLDF